MFKNEIWGLWIVETSKLNMGLKYREINGLDYGNQLLDYKYSKFSPNPIH